MNPYLTPQEEMEILAKEMFAMQMIDRWQRQDYEDYDRLKARYNKLQNEVGGLPPTLNATLQVVKEIK